MLKRIYDSDEIGASSSDFFLMKQKHVIIVCIVCKYNFFSALNMFKFAVHLIYLFILFNIQNKMLKNKDNKQILPQTQSFIK